MPGGSTDAWQHVKPIFQAIAAKDGVIGIWPNGSGIPFMSSMMRHIDHVKNLVGVDHIAIGSDRRGMRYYTTGFGSRGNFNAISAALLKRGYSDNDVGKIMGDCIDVELLSSHPGRGSP